MSSSSCTSEEPPVPPVPHVLPGDPQLYLWLIECGVAARRHAATHPSVLPACALVAAPPGRGRGALSLAILPSRCKFTVMVQQKAGRQADIGRPRPVSSHQELSCLPRAASSAPPPAQHHYRVGTMSSILRMSRTASVARLSAEVVTSSGCTTFSSSMSVVAPLRTLMPAGQRGAGGGAARRSAGGDAERGGLVADEEHGGGARAISVCSQQAAGRKTACKLLNPLCLPLPPACPQAATHRGAAARLRGGSAAL